MASEESQALRHAFFAERAAAKIPGVDDKTPQRKVERVAVIGSGTMGSGIAMSFANAGIPVTLLDAKQEALDRGMSGIRKFYEGAAAKGKLKPDEAKRRAALITPALDFAAAANADLIIEAVFEDIAVKKSVFRELDRVRPARCDSRHQHLDARRGRHRRVHQASRRCTRICISSVRRTSCGCWKWCVARRPDPTYWPPPWRWPARSARRRWCPASATASSAIACSIPTRSRPC